MRCKSRLKPADALQTTVGLRNAFFARLMLHIFTCMAGSHAGLLKYTHVQIALSRSVFTSLCVLSVLSQVDPSCSRRHK